MPNDLDVNGKTPTVAWVPTLDDVGDGTTTLTDLIGSNDGTLTNMDAATDWVDDGGKREIDFDGSNDHIVVPSDSAFESSPITISVWIKPDSVSAGYRALVSNRSNAGLDRRGFIVYQNGGFIELWTGNGGSWNKAVSGSVLVANQWQLVTAVIDGGLTTYRNATQVATSGAGYRTTSLHDLRIGAGVNESAAGLFFDGSMDDIRIWDQALTSGDISLLHSRGRGGIETASKLISRSRAVNAGALRRSRGALASGH